MGIRNLNIRRNNNNIKIVRARGRLGHPSAEAIAANIAARVRKRFNANTEGHAPHLSNSGKWKSEEAVFYNLREFLLAHNILARDAKFDESTFFFNVEESSWHVFELKHPERYLKGNWKGIGGNTTSPGYKFELTEISSEFRLPEYH